MMGTHRIPKLSSLLLTTIFFALISYPSSVVCRDLGNATDNGELQAYLVHVKRPDHLTGAGSEDLENWYRSFLPETPHAEKYSSSHDDQSRLVYSYTEAFSGFAAMLNAGELEEMSKKAGFVHAYPDETVPLLTTHTPDFLGLNLGATGNIWNSSSLGKGVVIGFLDTGINPEHPSFHDDGVPPPPEKWKGHCQFEKGCNNKVIGAREFGLISRLKINKPAAATLLDEEGHGTHTATTAAGNFVKNVNAFGLGAGTAAGMAPHAHVASYKVCYKGGCSWADMVAALDAAIKDGVDVLSLSLGGKSMAYDVDPIAIGAGAAIEKGIVVVCAGGNSGPAAYTLSNEAPWIVTVGASTVDRQFRATVRLGDGKQFDGEALFQPSGFSSKYFPLVYPGPDAATCDSFGGVDVRGKIVLCMAGGDKTFQEKAEHVKNDGGAGLIVFNSEREGYTLLAKDLGLPASHVSHADGLAIKSYLNSSPNPTATIIFNHTLLGIKPAPSVAHFSSRGPNNQSPDIIKPDISAPGVNIIAGWHTIVDPQSSGFNIVSGTSMATPHVSGIAALLKSVHPDWSSAAIKSAIMTTARILDNTGGRIKDQSHRGSFFYDMGVGLVNPQAAASPGLVYDMGVNDYAGLLCGMGYDDVKVVQILSAPLIKCSDVKVVSQSDLNYPSVSVHLRPGFEVTVNRTVTNVGKANDKYSVKVYSSKSVSVSVNPATLQFSQVNEKQTFSVTLTARRMGKGMVSQGNFDWISGKVVVRTAFMIVT